MARMGHGGSAKTPDNTHAFFKAVAGKRSPLNRQSSRIAKPFADNPFLGGGNTGTVATPAEQAFLAKDAAKKGDPQARTIEQNYVKAADTQRVVPKTTPRPGGQRLGTQGGVRGAALTAPDVAAQASRALDLIQNRIPLGAQAHTALDAISKFDLPNDQRQQVIGGFAHDRSLDSDPYAKPTLVADAMAKGNPIPAHATTRQLLDAALGPKGGTHHSLWDIVNPLNIAKDALLTPVYTAEGGHALGHATVEAVKGNPSEIEAIGKGELQQIEHPLLTAEKNPFQTGLAIATGLKTVGKGVGLAQGLEATPRAIPTDFEFGGHTLDRGLASTNAYTRLGQTIADKRLARSPAAQRRFMENDARTLGNLESSTATRLSKAQVAPATEAAKRLSPARRDSLLANEAQGGSAAEFADMWDKKAAANESAAAAQGGATGKKLARLAKQQRAQANLRRAQAKKWGPLATAKDRADAQAFLDTHRTVGDQRTHELTHAQTPGGTTALDQTSALWRDYQHNIELRASQGNERAIQVKMARNALDEQPMKGNNAGPVDPVAFQAAHDRLASALDHYIINEHGLHIPGHTVDESTFNPTGDEAHTHRQVKDTQGNYVAHIETSQVGGDYHIGHVETDQAARNSTIALHLLDHAIHEAGDRPITAHFANERLGRIADRYFAKKGYTRESVTTGNGATVRYTRDPSIPLGRRAGSPNSDIFPEGQRPFRVPTHTIKGSGPIRRNFGAAKALAAKTDVRQGISNLGHSFGESLDTGNFLTRHQDFLRQAVEPHRALAGIRYANRLKERYGRPLAPGETVREGEVIVTPSNLKAGLRGALSAEGDLNEHADALQNIADEYKIGATTRADKTVPITAKPGSYYALPTPVVEQIMTTLERAKPSKLRDVTRAYKKSVLFTRVAYPASNFVNSAAQSALGGVTAGAVRHRNEIEAPDGLLGHGFMANYLPGAERTGFRSGVQEAKLTPGTTGKTWAVTKGIARALDEQGPQRIRDVSVGADDFWRKALYAHKAYAAARKLAYPDEGTVSRLLRHRSIADEKILAAYHEMAHAPEGTVAHTAMREAVKATTDFLGDFENMKRYPALDLMIPFNAWTRFSMKLLLKTLPLKYPGRTLLMYQVSRIGQQGSSQQGILPQYLQEQIPLGGAPTGQFGAYTQRANPLATLGTTFAPLSPGTPNAGAPNIGAGFLGSLNPTFGVIANAASGYDLQQGRQLRDENGDPIAGNLYAQGRYILSQIEGLLPPLTALAGGTRGQADTSLPLFDEQSRNITKDPLGGQQPSGPSIGPFKVLPILNQFLPLRIDERNMTADQIKGMRAYRSSLISAANKSAAPMPPQGTPAYDAWIAKITNTAGKLGKNISYYFAHPEKAQQVIDEGTK